ncbi:MULTISPECIES: MGH1-like glycoside hydrolase domain-containing protein [unclassified Synechococcus]|uniref:MGH1-like glycoside hydrolase domain-containing protein n=1 Tax=unclassified Synechococcus TaxID=2626047 RepID=UPI0020CCDB33|nr:MULTISPECIES: glucosidase [unclassified Synechococcus]
MGSELRRMAERDHEQVPWDLWGSYLPDRQWGTVREDYSADGNAWVSFPHDHARSRVYRWGEDGLLGICDNQCRLCFSVALWNGVDPILKERPYGLGNPEGNHGEDIKDYYFHIANTPTHSFMRGLYKYPQQRFPDEQLIAENARRGRDQPEYELVDTGIFDESRYFDVFIEYAKASPDDIAIRIRVLNRGPEAAPLTLLPTLWLRNTWSWGYPDEQETPLQLEGDAVLAHPGGGLGAYRLACREQGDWLFTDNETNTERLFGEPNAKPFQKDGFHRFLIDGDQGAINPQQRGTKAARLLRRTLAAGEEWTLELRLTGSASEASAQAFGEEFDQLFTTREQQWHDFFESRVPNLSEDDRLLHNSGAAGLLWCKKYYGWSVQRWLTGDPTTPPPPHQRWLTENAQWQRLHAHDVISMPDAWEYPYFCQWDLMFHSVAFAVFDPATAKEQCMLLRSPHYTAPNAQTPAYEWALSDPNPPIGAWAAMRIFQIDRKTSEEPDFGFLRSALRKLILEYGWWANRNDRSGDNVFEGGFLGLDNIAVFDRRYPLADGSHIEQCDGTSWMASLSLNLLNISVELSREEPEYADIAERFVYDFVQLALTLNTPGSRGYVNWDEQDGFYYDVIKRPDGSTEYLRSRSVSGLIPLLAVASFDVDTVKRLPCLDVRQSLAWFLHERTRPAWLVDHLGQWRNDRMLFSLVPEDRLRRICERLFDEDEFLSPYGIRALSKVYEDNPYTFTEGSQTQTLAYSPADSPVAMFGGNSNWRGPVWMPINFLLIESLQKFGHYYGDSFMVEFPTRSGQWITLWDASLQLEQRLVNLFRRNGAGQRPFNGDVELFQSDRHWRDLIQFNEYFHGDNGRGVGASHQTGWSAMVCKMINQLSRYPVT